MLSVIFQQCPTCTTCAYVPCANESACDGLLSPVPCYTFVCVVNVNDDDDDDDGGNVCLLAPIDDCV